MFYINRDQMIETCSQIENLYHEYSQYNIELVRSIRILDSMESTKNVTAGLKEQKNKMEDQQRMLRLMVRGLDKIIVHYQKCEKKICDYGEREMMIFPIKDVSSTDLESLREMLNSII